MADQYSPQVQLNQNKPVQLSDVWKQPTPAEIMEQAMMPQRMLAGRIQITNALAQSGMDAGQINKMLGQQGDDGMAQGAVQQEQVARQRAALKDFEEGVKIIKAFKSVAGGKDGLKGHWAAIKPALPQSLQNIDPADFTDDDGYVLSRDEKGEPTEIIKDVDGKPYRVKVGTGKTEPAVADARKYREIQKKLELKQPVSPEEMASAHAYEKEQGLKGNVIQMGRKETMLETPIWAYDKNTGDVINTTKGDMNKDPGRYTSPEMALKIKSKRAMFDEIEQSSETLKKTATKVKWNTKDLAQYAVALRTNDDGSAIRNMVQSQTGKTLSPEQMEYVNAIMNMRESAYALRGAGGAGLQSSDMLRRAIDNMVPSGSTFSKADFDSKMRLFDMQVRALKSGIPGLGYGTNKETEKRAKGSNYKPFDSKIEPRKAGESIADYLKRTKEP